MVPYNPAPRLAKQLGLSGELGAFAASLLGRDADQGSVPRVLGERPWCILKRGGQALTVPWDGTTQHPCEWTHDSHAPYITSTCSRHRLNLGWEPRSTRPSGSSEWGGTPMPKQAIQQCGRGEPGGGTKPEAPLPPGGWRMGDNCCVR